jgi:imidazolonepropionase
MKYDLQIKNVRIATVNNENQIIPCGRVFIKGNKIAKIECHEENEDSEINIFAKKAIDGKGLLLTPGLIDCHTHMVFAGDRSNELFLRNRGESYCSITKRGGGILSTVKQTQITEFNLLENSAVSRAKTMLKQGVTTIEIKSGYGLNLNTEEKILKVAKALEFSLPISVITTYLGLHAIPEKYKYNIDLYVNKVIERYLPVIAEKKLATFVDAFCDKIAFTKHQVERYLNKAKQLGFKLKLHAEQMSDQKGALMAAKLGAHSVDHLEYLSKRDCLEISKMRTVAVLLPGAYYYLKEVKLPPIDTLQEYKIPIAIASDANPGTSPFFSLPLIMNMACVIFGLDSNDILKGVTLNAARALGISDNVGSVEVGKIADLVLWKTKSFERVIASPTEELCSTIIKEGKIVKL